MEVLRSRAHRHGRGIHESLGDEARVEVDLLRHRVVAHVLDAAGEHDVAGTERDLSCTGGHGRQRARAHPVDREAGNRLRNAGKQRNVAAEGQSLVADLRGRREDHVADALDGNSRIATQELADDLDPHVVGARLPEHPLRPRAPERRAHAVDEHDLPAFHGLSVFRA